MVTRYVMERIADSLCELVGSTPVVRLTRFARGVAVKKVISVRSQARGLANDCPMDGKPGLRSGVLREPSRLPCCSERCPTARGLADPEARS